MEPRDTLLQEEEKFITELQKNISFLKTEGMKTLGKVAMVTGGVFLGFYLIKKMFFSDTDATKLKETKDNKNTAVIEKEEYSISDAMKNIIISYFLAYAREKLIEYINEQSEKEKSKV